VRPSARGGLPVLGHAPTSGLADLSA